MMLHHIRYLHHNDRYGLWTLLLNLKDKENAKSQIGDRGEGEESKAEESFEVWARLAPEIPRGELQQSPQGKYVKMSTLNIQYLVYYV